MSNIDFSQERFSRIRQRYTQWWEGKNETPIAGMAVRNKSPKGKIPCVPFLSQASVDLTTPVDKLLDAIEYEFSQYEYLGDAFPTFNMDCFGPGVAAAFLGCDLDNSTGRVWFHRKKTTDITKIKLEYDPDNVWYKRVLSFCRAARERFGGEIIFGMPDLGGVLDIASTFFPGEELLYLLYDEEDAVVKFASDIQDLWYRFYRGIAEALNCEKYGYCDWSGIYSQSPSYVLQCDFSYMISSDMFNKFALPTLSEDCRRLYNTIFHLDGIKELNHLDSLLSIKELKAVQWVPGTGQKSIDEWPEVYKKIGESGKLIQVLNHGFDKFLKILEYVPRPEACLYQYHFYPLENKYRDSAIDFLKKINVEI